MPEWDVLHPADMMDEGIKRAKSNGREKSHGARQGRNILKVQQKYSSWSVYSSVTVAVVTSL